MNTIERAARAVVAHWDEFGPEHGMDEAIDNLRRVLKAQPYKGLLHTAFWINEAADFQPVTVMLTPTKLTQQSFDAMDETMGFEFAPVAHRSERSRWAEERGAVPDALDHSLNDQGSWTRRWLEAK